MRRNTVFIRGALAAALTLSSSLAGAADSATASADKAAPAVVVAPVNSENVAGRQKFSGRVQAIQSVALQAQVQGILNTVAFTEGSLVKKGDLLYQIDQAQYKAHLDQAQAQLAAAQAQVASAKAKAQNAELNYQRKAKLARRGDASQAQADDARANRDMANAAVKEAQAAVQQAQAQIEQAKINLGYTTLTAPISGRMGATQVTQGNLIKPGSGTLATLVQLDPIRVVFSIPEDLWIRFSQQAGTADQKNDAARDAGADADAQPAGTNKIARELFTPTLTLATGEDYPHKGTIAFASNQVDAATGAVAIYADFPNPKGALLPGGFATVTVAESKAKAMPVVPMAAVQRDRKGQYVFVLDPSTNTVSERRVTVDTQVHDGWALSKGLTDGELIVVQGIQKIHPGAKVTPHNEADQNSGKKTNKAAPQTNDGNTGKSGD